MAKYTAMIKEFCDQFQDGTKKSSELIELARTELFDFDYPIFDEAYKNVFETHFIRNFYMREIGFETFGLFKFHLETWMIINMPYFNKLFESELIEFDPLINSKVDQTYTKKTDTVRDSQRNDENNSSLDRKTTSDNTKTGTNTDHLDSSTDKTSTGKSTNTNSQEMNQSDDDFTRDIEADTPDSRLELTTNDGEGVLEYASKIKEQNTNNASNQTTTGTSDTENSLNDTESSTQSGTHTMNQSDNTIGTESNTFNDNKISTTNDTINTMDDYIQHRTGKIGIQTYSKMLNEFRSTFLRIETKIFDEMNELFMLVY